MRKQLLLLLPILAFLAVTFAYIFQLQDDFSQDDDEVRGTVLWIATEVNREYWRFLDALSRYSLGDETLAHEDLLLRRDIFWAQLDSYRSGALGDYLGSVGSNKDIADAVISVLVETETTIDALSSGDAETGQRVRERFAEYTDAVNEMTQEIDKAENAYFVDLFNTTERSVNTLSWLMVVTAAIAALLVFMLLRVIRRAETAETDMRRINETLEDQVAARTASLNELLEELDDAQAIANIGSFTWDLRSGNVTWSPNMYRMFGYDPDSDIDIKLINAQIHHPDDLPWVTEWLEDGIRNRRPTIGPKQYRCIRADGETVWIQCRARIELESDEPLIMVGTVEDISESKAREEQLRRSQKMDALGKLTGGVAHDYNNMLAVITGYAELLTAALSDNERLATYADQILHAADRGAKLSNKLLGFSRRKSTEERVVSLNAVLKDSELMLRKTFTARINLSFDLDATAGKILIDPNDLEDAILNISINAMHAIQGNGAVNVRTETTTITPEHASQLELEPGPYVALSISDSGIGMDQETMDRMFDPFFTTKGDQGTGLGMSQVYGLVKRSHGGIKVHSQPGKGTVVTLLFPVHEDAATASAKEEIAAEVDLHGDERILVVDDEPAILDLTAKILRPYGYRVITAENGADAIKRLVESDVDLILSDVIMPQMDGYELTSFAQAHFPKVKVLLTSGYSDDRRGDLVTDEVSGSLIRKPYNSRQLLTRIRTTLEG